MDCEAGRHGARGAAQLPSRERPNGCRAVERRRYIAGTPQIWSAASMTRGTRFPGASVSRSRDDERTRQFDRARDELFSHIHRCEVLGADEAQQFEWMDDTIEYLGERHRLLGPAELEELKQIGLRFCRPVIRRTESEPTPSSADGHLPDEAAAA
jgi:hypothetical protein